MNRIFLFVFVFLLFANEPGETVGKEKTQSSYLWRSPRQIPGETALILQQPNGPFAAMVFQEDALGNHLGIIYYRGMRDPNQGKWELTDRFWQEDEWGSSITSCAWSSDEKFLYVATESIYGDGDVFELNLLQRTSRRIFPTKEFLKQEGLKRGQYSTELMSVDHEKHLLHVRLTVETPTSPARAFDRQVVIK
jgi:hypothetical protein